MVTKIWNREHNGSNAMERWQNKICAVCQHLRGWAPCTAGVLKKEKSQLTLLIDELDKKAENTLLTPDGLAMKHFLNEILAHILCEEELKWYQHAIIKELLEGDSNTQYFHLVANGVSTNLSKRNARLLAIPTSKNISPDTTKVSLVNRSILMLLWMSQCPVILLKLV